MADIRRKVVTYGKRANKGHSLFSQLDPNESDSATQPASVAREVKVNNFTERSEDQRDATIFDVPSSDEGANLPGSNRKRRRLTPVATVKSTVTADLKRPIAASTTMKSTSNSGSLKRENAPSVNGGMRKSPSKAVGKINKISRPTKGHVQPKKASVTRPALRSPSVSPVTSDSSRSPSQQPLTPPRRTAKDEVPLSYTAGSSSSIPTPKETPQQVKRLQTLDAKGRPDSPSKLELSRLQLKSTNASTDDSSSDPENIHEVRETVQLKRKPASSRTRLIDSLGPMQSSTDLSNITTDTTEEVEHNPGNSVKFRGSQTDDVSSVLGGPAVEKSTSSQPALAPGPKLTYGKQRSYLSDMASDLLSSEGLNSSQKSNLSHSSQFDGFDMMDMDEDTGAGGIRSIHELRKAGEAVRFQESLDSIFEDMASMSRGRKIIGYTQLSHKLQDANFRTQFISSAMDRRLEKVLARGTEDIVEMSLHCAVSAWVLSDSQVTSRMIQATTASMIPRLLSLLREENSLDVIASDRRQNLSKATRKELASFQSELLQSSLWDGLQLPTIVSPQLLALRLVDAIVLRSKELHDSTLIIPLAVLEFLIDLLLRSTHATELQSTDVCRMELIVSILESYTVKMVTFDSAHVSVLSKLADLGPLLQLLSSSTRPRYRQVQHLVLRLILNITNNNAVLCEAFAQAPLVAAILHIIMADFVHLTPTGAPKAEETEAVILSLGTAINFGEMSPSARELISSSANGSSITYLDQLTALFRSNLETASTTIGEGQDLVAFGYLSVLLCTMCVDQASLQAIRSKLPGAEVRPLRQSLQDFLQHFRKIEEEVDVEYHDFTARFERILSRMDETSNMLK